MMWLPDLPVVVYLALLGALDDRRGRASKVTPGYIAQLERRSPAVPGLWGDRDAMPEALRTVVPPPDHGRLAPPWLPSGWPFSHWASMAA